MSELIVKYIEIHLICKCGAFHSISFQLVLNRRWSAVSSFFFSFNFYFLQVAVFDDFFFCYSSICWLVRLTSIRDSVANIHLLITVTNAKIFLFQIKEKREKDKNSIKMSENSFICDVLSTLCPIEKVSNETREKKNSICCVNNNNNWMNDEWVDHKLLDRLSWAREWKLTPDKYV